MFIIFTCYLKIILAIHTSSNYPEMSRCIKFMDENMQLCENASEYLHEQQDFLVVGCLGTQAVGKSTIMSLLTSHYSYVLYNLSYNYYLVNVIFSDLFIISDPTFLRFKIHLTTKIVQTVPLE